MFKAPFSFEGRIRRTEYGLSFVIYVVILTFLVGLAEFAGAGTYLTLLFLVPLTWFMFAQGAKRSHDAGNSAWLQLIPFYNIYLLFAGDDNADNKYGTNPKGSGFVFQNNNAA